MTRLTAMDLRPLYRSTIGADSLFNRILNQIESSAKEENYPPYNIISRSENEFEVQVAVAGFEPGEVELTVKDNTLIVTGEKVPTEESVETVYTHHGIGTRRFIRTFSLADGVEVKSAVCRNGILSVKLERIVPDEPKPKAIAISYEN